jgi:hypothetical protein
MNNSTGNSLSPNGRQPARSEGLIAIPDLVYPGIRWADDDYARLEARLDLFTDFAVLSKFFAGEVSEKYVVDPAEVAAALAGLDLGSGLLPENCLFWSKKGGWDRLGIYVPPRAWLVTVRDEPQAWRVPLPGLVFTGHEYNYSLWAVTERPASRQAPLYLVPCPNVSGEGVCRGSAPFPRAGTTSLWQAVDVFFSSKFNRDLSNAKSKVYPACILDQWRALHQAGAETYPLEDLVKTNLTLGSLIDAAD